MNWSLKELYTSFDSEEFQGAYKEIPSDIDELKRLADDLATAESKANALESYLLRKTAFYEKVMRLLDFCELTLSTDAEDKTALKYIESLETRLTEMTSPETKLSLFLKGLSENELSEMTKQGFLSELRFHLLELKAQAAHVLTEEAEAIIAKMEMTGGSAWEKYQDNLMATLSGEVTINGETKRLAFSEIRNLAYDKNAETRKAAYEAELKACERVAKACAASLNGIKGETLTVSALRGHKSPLDATILYSRLTHEILDALIASLQKNVAIFTPYFKKKAELLGHKNGALPFYDLFAPVGELDTKNFTFEEAAKFVIEAFGSFSKDMQAYAEKAVKNNWLDVYPKSGKRGGAFCQNMHYLKESRFLLNFSGSFSDVLTLAHELGHGYHGECLGGEAFLNSDYPMPIAETASTLCETIVLNAALELAKDKNEKLSILENGVSSSAQVTADILSRFLFEKRLFEKRKDGSLSADEMSELMLNAQKTAYGEGLCENHTHKYMWVVKPHYYSAHQSFYNFPYAFGLLFSNGLYGKFQENGAAFSETYSKMLALSGKSSLKATALAAGIDISEESFWDSAFDVIKRDIDKFLSF